MSSPDNFSATFGTSGQVGFNPSAVRSWIEMVHGESDGLIHICATGNWEGRTFSDPADAADFVARLDREGRQGIYMRTTTLARAPREYKRGSDEDSKTLPGFAADMDIAGPGHKTVKPLPPDVATCKAIIEATGLGEPTLWVHSGGGVYPWWLLDQGLDISDPTFLAQMQDLSTKLHETIARWAEHLGWFYGSGVKDMSRVLRIPGTVNRKVEDDPRQCEIMQPAGYHFYDLPDLAARIDESYRHAPKPVELAVPRPVTAPRPEGSVLRPGDDFNERAHWADILTPHGWTYMYHRGQTWYWRRPGKDSGEHSATTGRKGMGGEDRLFVFSDATAFEPNVPYNKFAAYTLLNHGALNATAFASATLDLRGQGFGGELPQIDHPRDTTSLVKPAAQVGVAVQPVDDDQTDQAVLVVQANQSLPVVDHDELPEVDLGSEQEAMLEICRVISSGLIPNLYVRDGQLVHVHPKNGTRCSEVTVAVVGADLLNLLLAQHVRTFKWISGGKDNPPVRKPCAPALSALRAVTASSYWPDVRPLNGVIGTPTLRPDGTLIQECGYDQATGLYLAPAVKVDTIPQTISDQQVRTSREFVFKKVFGEFCWSSVGDFSNYMALLLSPMMRPYVKTTTPFGMITATTRGSGKTNLTDAIGMTYGQTSQVLPGRSEELQKKITSILIGNSSPVVVFDNLKEGTSVSSEILATLITKDDWDDRMLGASKNIEAHNDRLWLASGNGLGVGGDMASRTVMVRLDPKMAKPELRTFEMGQFSDWIREDGNREELLFHLLVLVQAWMQAGAVKDTSHTMRGFTRWAQIMGGLLAFHGLTDFLGNADDLEARDTDAEEWMVFLAKWHEVFATQTRTSKELHTSAQVDWIMGTSVDRWAKCFITDDDGLTPTPKRLGMMLAGHKDRFYGQYVLRSKRNTATNSTEWWVEKMEEVE